MSRYLSAVYAARVDLQRAYPDPEGGNFQGFATWVRHEVDAGRLEPRLGVVAVPPAGTRVRLTAARQLERVGNRLSAVPVPGTGDERVRLNMAGSLHYLERRINKLPVPRSGERMRLNTTRALGRLERRLAAVPVPGTSDERVRLNAARFLGRLERRLGEEQEQLAVDGGPVEETLERDELLPGIRVSGYLRTESGVGELGRLAVATSAAAGIPTSTHVDTGALSRQEHPFVSSGGDLNVNLDMRQRRRAAQFRQTGRPRLFPRPLHDWPLGVGTRGVPGQLLHLVRLRGRGLVHKHVRQ